jgi:hypothetical protein
MGDSLKTKLVQSHLVLYLVKTKLVPSQDGQYLGES